MYILCLLKVSFLKQLIVTLFYRQTMSSFRGHIRFTLTLHTVFLLLFYFFVNPLFKIALVSSYFFSQFYNFLEHLAPLPTCSKQIKIINQRLPPFIKRIVPFSIKNTAP